MRKHIVTLLSLAVFFLTTHANQTHAGTTSESCENLIVLWQVFAKKILRSETYAEQLRRELTARLGRPQEFMARKKIDPDDLVFEQRFIDGSINHRAQLVTGRWKGKRVIVKVFWQSPETLDNEIGGAIIQDFLSEVELSPKVYGIILDSDKIEALRQSASLPRLIDQHARSGMYFAMVMEYIPQSFNIPNGRFMPPWYISLDKENLNHQISRVENVLWRLGIQREMKGEFLVTEHGRIYAVDFTDKVFDPDRHKATHISQVF